MKVICHCVQNLSSVHNDKRKEKKMEKKVFPRCVSWLGAFTQELRMAAMVRRLFAVQKERAEEPDSEPGRQATEESQAD